MKKHNFSAGPSILPEVVFRKASQSILDFNNTGLSIIEISHRDKKIVDVMNEAQDLTLELLGLEDKGYKVLFLQGGASLQFLMVAHNMLENKAAYVDTGNWSSKAIKEGKTIGDVDVIASSKDKNYNYIPKEFSVPSDVDYLHITTNNTIFGTQYKELPNTDVTLISDMSSDIFSCKRDFSKFGIIYAGAQKNMGPSGVTLVIIKEDILGKVSRTIPTMLNYNTHLKAGSMFNTPPVFAVYVSMLTLQWLKEKGGLSTMEKINIEKSNALYQEIDRNPLLIPFANKDDRSTMNVTFNLVEDKYKNIFDTLLAEANICNLNGHKSVGGYRASIYNAMPQESVQVLIETMQKFEKTI